MMSKVEIFDPAMCCSTGVCGPGVDPELLRVATIINSLQKAGKDITRHNLKDEPEIYVTNQKINEVLMNQGADALPITLVDDEVVLTGKYPTNEEFVKWTGVTVEELAWAMLIEEMGKNSCCSPSPQNGGCCCSNSDDSGCC